MLENDTGVKPGFQRLKGLRLNNIGLIIIFVFIFVLFSMLSGKFLTVGNLTNILIQNADSVLIAIGMTFVLLTGGIDLSVGSIVVVSAYVTGILMNHGMPVIICILAGLIMGMLMGLVNGIVIAKLKVTPFIMTLGMMNIGRGIIYVYSQGIPISNLTDPAFRWLSTGKAWVIPVPILIVILVAVVSYILLNNMKIGRHIYAIGCNKEAAKLAGIRIETATIFVYIISGLFSALSGILLTSRLSSATASLGSGMELTAIAAVVLGGTSLNGGSGGVLGSIAGAYLMACLSNGFVLLNINPYWQTVVTGLIVIVAVALDQFKKK